MSVFSKNAIMSGCVDLYCLACETPLRSDEDAVQHISKPVHRKNLDGTSYLDKYKADRVRKVKKGYFCEVCSLFMRTAAKVGPHVAEDTHRENKTQQLFRRAGNGVLAFDTVLISEASWHGLIDDTCAVCDAEFDNEQIHKTDSWHALNLVLIEIELEGRNVYRKVDESTFQCMTCNMVCALNTMSTHFEGAEHKKLYKKCCDAAKANINEKPETTEAAKEDKQKKTPETETEKTVKEEKTKKPEEQATKEPEKQKESKDDKTKSDNKSKKSPQTESAKQTPKPAEKEKSKTAETEKKDSNKGGKDVLGKTDKDICKGLGAVEYITRDLCGKQWCILCDWAMDDHAVEAHIKSRHHQTILKMHKERTEKNQANEDTKLDETNILLNIPSELQNNYIDINAAARTAFCRKCSKNMEFDYMLITNHIEEHKKAVKEVKVEKEVKQSSSEQKAIVHKNDSKPKQEKESRASSVSSTREDAEVESFAKQHNLTYTRDNNNAFCRVCVTKVPASIKNMREHINGISHKNKVAKTTVKTTTKTPTMTPSHAFIDNVFTIENMFSKDIVINEKFVVNILSFLMITKNGSKLRCQACEVNVSEIDAHKNTPKHERIMNDAMVASSVETEFIREIRPNLFHCGYCNQLEATWATMETHLKSTAHREAKTAASWRMMEYTPMIAHHKMRQRMEFALFTRMLMGQMFGDD